MQTYSAIKLAVAPLAAALALVLAPCAGAATLSADYGTHRLAFAADPGEVNHVVVAPAANGGYSVDDTGASAYNLTEIGGSGCRSQGPVRYVCPSPVVGIAVSLADGADTLSATAAVPMTVVAGEGVKRIATGSGDDTIDARNGAADTIACGQGNDVVQADDADHVDPSCEDVVRTGADGEGQGDSPAGGADGTDDSAGSNGDAPAIGAPIGIVLPEQPLTSASPRSVVAHLACSDQATEDCRGSVDVSVFERRQVRGKAIAVTARGHYVAQQRSIGHRGYRVRRGKQAALPVRVAYRGHYSLVTRRRRVRAKVTVTQRDGAGKVIGVTTRETWLALQKNKWSRRRGRR